MHISDWSSDVCSSDLIFGFGLTALIATTAVYLRNRVEDQVIGAALVKNNNVFAEGFYRNPNAIGVPFEKIQGRQFSTSKLDRVPDAWRDLSNGVHELTETDPVTGEERVYRLAVRKDAQYWFFLAYDIAEERESQQRLNRALIGSVGIFTLLSALIGWWSAARVMSPVSELARRLQASGDSMQPDQQAEHFPEDEVGQLASAPDDYAERARKSVV